MAKITLANFAGGIQASPGFIPNSRNTAASDIRNMIVDGNGRLTRRAGSSHKNASALSNSLLRVIPCYNAPGGETTAENPTTIRTHLFVQATGGNADGLLYWDGSAFASVTVNPDPSSVINNFFNAEFDWVIADGRLFLCNGYVTFWVSLASDPSSTTPQLYWWGLNPNTSSGHTPSAMPTLLDDGADLKIVAGGSLTAGFYGYAFTYYSNPSTTLFGTSKGTGAESRPSVRDETLSTVQGVFEVTAAMVTASDQTVRISNMDAHDDPQITHKRIYRTVVKTGATGEADAAVADLQLIASGTITDATTTFDDTGSLALGITNDSNDHNNPPTNLEKITFHAGRIWGSRRLSSAVGFTKISSTGTLIVDHMPNINATVPHQFFVNKDDGDFITALEPSPSGQRIHIFKENSVTIAQGTGLITGLYQPVTGLTGVDLDISLVNRSAGCIAPKSVATVGGKVTLFYGVDKQIWAMAGSEMQPISLPIQPLLDDIPITRLTQPVGVGYRNRYLLAFPSGDNANDLIADYDLNRKYWTIHDLDSDDLAWATGGSDNDILYSILTDTNFVDEYFTGTQDSSVDFLAVWQSNWIQLPSEAIITGVYVYTISSVEVSVRVDADEVNGVAKDFIPSRSNRYRAGVFARGRMFRVRIFGTVMDNISRIEIEYETRS